MKSHSDKAACSSIIRLYLPYVFITVIRFCIILPPKVLHSNLWSCMPMRNHIFSSANDKYSWQYYYYYTYYRIQSSYTLCVSASVMLQANGKTCSIILRYLAFSPVFPIFTFRYMIDYYDNFRLYCIKIDVNKYYLEFYAE